MDPSMRTTRRSFMIGGLRVSLLAPLAGSLRGHGPGEAADEPVLVVLQLTGGNDGLNTVIPWRQDEYYRLRPYLALAPGSLHRLDDEHGLHPALAGLAELFAEGRLSVVQGVGHGHPDRSHFRSLEIWHTATTEGPPGTVGWLGRMADEIARRAPGCAPALAIESGGELPLSMRGLDTLTPTVRDARGFRLEATDPACELLRDELAGERTGGADDDLAFLRAAARSTYATARRMAEISDRPNGSPYPDEELAQRLRLVAQLVRGGFGTRIFHLSLDGFDTHARQGPVHTDRLGRVSRALTAFQRDLDAHGLAGRVLTFVFSEFGRRAEENASRGTDHGRGAPVFLIGGRARPGVFGRAPDLTRLVDGDVPAELDFRGVYGALERSWMGLEPRNSIPPLDLLA